jgi:threonylcarbamoyladenosine tRNA methylthiotransferase MtaB
LQSGCDETLKRMNRRYSTEEFREVVTRLRKAYNDVILTTDIIVGFPGETEEEFSKTYKFLKEINFYKMHIFPYSARKGTKAAEMSNQIDGLVKERRSKILIDLSNKNQLEYNKTYIGKKIEVLVEEGKGHTANYILVKGMGEDKSLENKLINLKITEANIEYLQGNIL